MWVLGRALRLFMSSLAGTGRLSFSFNSDIQRAFLRKQVLLQWIHPGRKTHPEEGHSVPLKCMSRDPICTSLSLALNSRNASNQRFILSLNSSWAFALTRTEGILS